MSQTKTDPNQIEPGTANQALITNSNGDGVEWVNPSVGIQSITGSVDIVVDNTDPLNPELNFVPTEGIFTPLLTTSLGNDYTYSLVTGAYTKIGKQVLVNIIFGNISNPTSTDGSLRVLNLPFNSNGYFAGGICSNDLTDDLYNVIPVMTPSSNIVFFKSLSTSNPVSNVSWSPPGGLSPGLILSIYYNTDD